MKIARRKLRRGLGHPASFGFGRKNYTEYKQPGGLQESRSGVEKLVSKKGGKNGEVYEVYTNKTNLGSSRKLAMADGEVMYSASDYEPSGSRSKWKNVTIPLSPTDQFTHTMWFLIHDLDPATQYEARVFAKNRYGWSDPPREAFRFTTRGAGWCISLIILLEGDGSSR
ncbi:hypothetical protein U1Q18_051483 [Sarracenia purpurea var. burkii]